MSSLSRRSGLLLAVLFLSTFLFAPSAFAEVLEADLAITKVGNPATVVRGGALVYTITVTNNGPGEATGVYVADAFDPDLGACSWTSLAAGGASGNDPGPSNVSIVDAGITMPVASTVTYSVTCTIPADATFGEDILSNVASVTPGDQTDPDLTNNNVQENTSVAPVSDLSIEKEADAAVVVPGGTIKYTLSVTNNGPDDAENVVIEDTLPVGMTVVPKLPLGCDESLGVVTCTLPSVPVTPSPTSIMLTLMAGDDLQPVVNTVEIIGSDSEEPPAGPTGPQEDMVAGQIAAALPADGTAVIAVQKDFTDGNDETDVTLTLSCTSGDYDPAPVVVSPDNGPAFEKIFVISNIPLANNEGATCTVTEEPVKGYDAEYRCYPEESMSDTDENCEPKSNGNVKKSNFACKYSDVQMGDSNTCLIANVPAPVEVEVTKVWEIVNTGGDAFNRDVLISVGCDAEIIGGYEKGNKWYYDEYLDDSAGAYEDEEGDDVGMATVTVLVIPEWYKTAADPKKQKSTECWGGESGLSSAVEVESDCGDKDAPGMQVSAGMGDSCTITNTLFFEGIPTLSQYGMALMALLMLGIGLVGFRRFA